MPNHDHRILVFGATGKQGGAVARELLERGHRVRAFVRSPHDLAAKELVKQGAALFPGNLNDGDAIRQAMSGVTGVFSVQTMHTPHGTEGEIRWGVAVAEAAKETGAGHVVYSSVDGAERASGVPHFESKWAIEQKLAELDVPTTILRPTSFMENFAARPPAVVDGTLVVRLALPPDRPLQLVSVADIAVFAADAFERPDSYLGTALALAGAELTGPQIAAAFAEAAGRPARFEEQPIDEIRAFSEDVALMFEWIAEHGYQADIAALHRLHPNLRTLRDWLAETDIEFG